MKVFSRTVDGAFFGSVLRVVGRLVVSVLLVAAVCATCALAQRDVKIKLGDKREITPELHKIFGEIETAWQDSDAKKLSSFAGDSKVFLNVRGLGRRAGYYSRPQLYYMFKKMFEGMRNIRFEFVGFQRFSRSEMRVYGIAERSYTNTGRGRFFKDKVYVTLMKEEKKWVVVEIKTI